MTIKQLQSELMKERFDVRGCKVKVCLSSGERLDVVAIALDTDRNEAEITVTGAGDAEDGGGDGD